MKSDRIRRKDGTKKRTLDEEMDEDTKIEETRLQNNRNVTILKKKILSILMRN
jgi:hypothetical protein